MEESLKKRNIVSTKELFETENYIFDGKSSKNRCYNYICPNGHRHYMRRDHWLRGVRCPTCNGNHKLSIEQIRADFEKENYKLLTKKYVNSKQILVTLCPLGHKFKISRNNWTQGYRCSTCSGRSRNNLLKIKNNVESYKYELLSNKYLNNKKKIKLLCSNGHKYKVSWDNWSSKGSRCPKCNEWGISKQEKELYAFVRSLDDSAISSDRELISPYEIDIVIPNKRIAIEYCGLYWHSELMGKDKNYHLNKRKMCNKIGYSLITIFEDELISSLDVVFSRLSSIIGSNKLTSIYSRKCLIKEIDTKTASEFCNKNHLQGYGAGASVKIGAFYNNALVAVMTFSKPSLSKGYKEYNVGQWELHRFCSKINYRIVGVASKLLSFFKKNYKWNQIFSYADMRWSNGVLYEKIGFSCVGNTQPNYWYFKNNKRRHHRFALRKESDEPKDITEWELRKSQGWNRIWDCGNLKYILGKEL